MEFDHPFVSVAVLPELFADYNEDAGLRSCPKCAHVNAPFPVAAWGWDKYADQSAVAIAGRQALDEVARGAK
jgi:hypothetical protein